MNDDDPTPAAPLDEAEARRRLSQLRQEHEDLDASVQALEAVGHADQIRIARLKKRKLMLRDEIAWLESRLIPDSIA